MCVQVENSKCILCGTEQSTVCVGTLNTLNFLRNNTTQLSKSPDIYTIQNVSDYATAFIYARYYITLS